MRKKQYELSRRKILGSLGAIGVASAGAGLGTTAYFNDEESFDGNAIVAGKLDMTVDWEEHYYGAGDYSNGLTYEPVSDLAEIPGGLSTEWRAFPTPDAPHVYVYKTDVPQFMRNTAIEAYPDVNDDGVQDEFDATYANYPNVGPACEDGANLPSDMDPTRDSALRTLSDDTYDSETETVEPLVSLHDVKPGDFGEVTFSLHLCDNPGYVWLTGELVEDAENGQTEPETGVDTTNDEGELAEALRVIFWYDEDPGDNVYMPDSESEEAILGQRDGIHTEPVSLAEAMTYLQDGRGIPLDGAVLNNYESQPDSKTFEELEEPPTDDARDCFVAGESYYVGFAWWLPADVGNEVQTDAVSFDLGFYTEQCRHNDGSGTDSDGS